MSQEGVKDFNFILPAEHIHSISRERLIVADTKDPEYAVLQQFWLLLDNAFHWPNTLWPMEL